MSKHTSNNNPFHNSVFTSQKPMEQSEKPVEKGELFVEEEMEREIGEIDEIEEHLASAKADHRSSDELREEVRTLEGELKEVRETLLRAHAEMDNVRRRTAIDVQKAHKYSIEKIIKELLPVVDSLEKALESGIDMTAQIFHEGVELTHQMLLQSLEKNGVKVLNPLNQPFDPNLHQAMSMQPSPGVEPNTVVMVFQKGYELNGRLIRPALVVISQPGAMA